MVASPSADLRAGRTIRDNLVWPRVGTYLRNHALLIAGLVVGFSIFTAALLWIAGARGFWFGFLFGVDLAVLSCGITWLAVEQSGAELRLSAFLASSGVPTRSPD